MIEKIVLTKFLKNLPPKLNSFYNKRSSSGVKVSNKSKTKKDFDPVTLMKISKSSPILHQQSIIPNFEIQRLKRKFIEFNLDNFNILLISQTTEVLPFVPVIPIILFGGKDFNEWSIKFIAVCKFSTINCGIFKFLIVLLSMLI